jgi:ribosome maturation factor RimP
MTSWVAGSQRSFSKVRYAAQEKLACPAMTNERNVTGPVLLEQLLMPAVEAAGFRLVRLRLKGGERKVLQVMAERADGTMDVEDCAALSHTLSDVLEAADPIENDYVLEVSSPGIDRPLTALADFARFSGHEARIELALPGEDGRRRYKGVVMGVEGKDVLFDAAEGKGVTRLRFAFSNIADAKLVLTDRLIKESLKAQELRKGAKTTH